jgi:hypothetical protein
LTLIQIIKQMYPWPLISRGRGILISGVKQESVIEVHVQSSESSFQVGCLIVMDTSKNHVIEFSFLSDKQPETHCRYYSVVCATRPQSDLAQLSFCKNLYQADSSPR